MDVIVLILLLLVSVISDEIALKWQLSIKTTEKKEILREVFGEAKFGHLHAIVGPSGSGKSSLLNALSSVTPKGSLKLSGGVWCAKSLEDVEPIYVEQEDRLFPQLTVEETLRMSISLSTSASLMTYETRSKLIDKLILDLGLKKVRHTKVGDRRTRGISGGELKRLSIGTEIIRQLTVTDVHGDGVERQARVIFADEPTSGLDSFQAQRVMQLLKELADKGNVVIASIHQPRASVWKLFDDITLLSEGRVMYTGAAGRHLGEYFGDLGFPLPGHVNPCEHYVDVISVDVTSPELETESYARIDRFATAAAAAASAKLPPQETSASPSFISVRSAHHSKNQLSLPQAIRTSFRKFSLLFSRALKTIVRDKPLNTARLMSSLFSGLLFGAIYYQLPPKASSVADRLGLLQVAAVNCAMTSLIKATTSFVSEKLIIQRERRSGAVTVTPYFLSKLAAELPVSALFPALFGGIMYKLCGLNPAPGRFVRFILILIAESFAASAFGMAVGSLVPTVESGVALAPALMVVFIVFGGLYVVNVPWYLQWLPSASLIRWAYQGMVINELDGLVLTPESRGGPMSISHGEEVLKNMNFEGTTVRETLLAQSAIVAVNYGFTLISLMRQRPSSEPIAPAASHVDGGDGEQGFQDDDQSTENLKVHQVQDDDYSSSSSSRSSDKPQALHRAARWTHA